MKLSFTKYQGTGNDFIMIDDRKNRFDVDDAILVARLCHRRFGIGADGLILLRTVENYDFRMVYFNADGKEGTFCGNGGRCIADFAKRLGIISEKARFLAADGTHEAKLKDGIVSLKMSNITHIEQKSDSFFLNTGSPHYVAFTDDLIRFDVRKNGAEIRYNDRFRREGTNVNFVEMYDKSENAHIFVRTYERGVEDETLSCGTGVTASAISAALKGLSSPVKVRTLGGDLEVSFDKNSEQDFQNVYLSGAAQAVYEGIVEI